MLQNLEIPFLNATTHRNYKKPNMSLKTLTLMWFVMMVNLFKNTTQVSIKLIVF